MDRKITIRLDEEWLNERLEKAGFKKTRENRTRLAEEVESELTVQRWETITEWIDGHLPSFKGYADFEEVED